MGNGWWRDRAPKLSPALPFTHKSPPSHSTPNIRSRSPKAKLIPAYGTDTIRSIGSRHTQIGSLKENIMHGNLPHDSILS